MATTPTPTKTAAATAAAKSASRKTGAAVIPANDLSRPKVESYDIASSADTLDMAKDLARFIKDNKLSTSVQGKDYVNVEGWQYAGSRLGIVPVVEHCINVSSEQETKFQAKVTLWDLRSQHTVGAGFAVCSNKESGKKFWQEFAVMSMSQTRATGKAFRNVLAWLIRAAGYEPTPAEEMDWDTNHAAKPHVQPLTEADHAQAQQAAPGKPAMPAGSSSAPPAVFAGSDLSDLETQRARIQVAKSTLELKDIWDGLTGGERKALQEEKDAAKLRIDTDVRAAATAPVTQLPVMQIVSDTITAPAERPADEEGEPIDYATASQRDEVIRLLNHPVITRKEKTGILLNINRLTQLNAIATAIKLRKTIDERENATTGSEWAEQLKAVVKSAEVANEAGTLTLSAEDIARLRTVAYDPGATPNQLRDALYEARELVRMAAVA